MLLKELRDWVNKLPVEMDEFVVVTREIKMDEEDLDKMLYKDFPLVSGIPDENTKRIVLHDYESQVVINEIREKTKPKDVE
jgi:Fe-S cluster assembly scaffold protein SufB